MRSSLIILQSLNISRLYNYRCHPVDMHVHLRIPPPNGRGPMIFYAPKAYFFIFFASYFKTNILSLNMHFVLCPWWGTSSTDSMLKTIKNIMCPQRKVR